MKIEGKSMIEQADAVVTLRECGLGQEVPGTKGRVLFTANLRDRSGNEDTTPIGRLCEIDLQEQIMKLTRSHLHRGGAAQLADVIIRWIYEGGQLPHEVTAPFLAALELYIDPSKRFE